MHWRLKGVIQKALGHLPFGDRMHHALQTRAGGLRMFDSELLRKIDDWRLMAGHLASVGVPLVNTRFVEIGTGWYPTFPFCLYLGGAESVITIDLRRHLKSD